MTILVKKIFPCEEVNSPSKKPNQWSATHLHTISRQWGNWQHPWL